LSDPFSRQLSAAFSTLVGITRLKNGPEDLPASSGLLVAAILLSTIPDLLTLAIMPLPEQLSPPVMMAVRIVTTLVWYGAILRLAQKPERFLQTLTAVFGIRFILAPALVFTGWFFLTYQQDAAMRVPATLLRTAVEIWALVILARILRSATGWHMFLCVSLSIANELLTYLLIDSIFPQPVTPAAAG